MAKGLLTIPRKRKPHAVAVITDCCTGCAGSPVCIPLCPVADCMILQMDDGENYPFGYIWVDPIKCIGCNKCITKGPMDIQLDGCPWDAIDMIPTPEWEADNGEMPY